MKIPSSVKVSISGIRGLAPSDLTPQLAGAFARAHCEHFSVKKLVISRDTRKTGKTFRDAIYANLQNLNYTSLKNSSYLSRKNLNIQIFDLDIAPLPTTQLAVEEFHADAGICITASHNPAEYNGLKLLNAEGEFISEQDIEAIVELMNSYENAMISGGTTDLNVDMTTVQQGEGTDTSWRDQAYRRHIDRIVALAQKGKHLTIAVDACNSSGSIIIPQLLEELNCSVIHLATSMGEDFPHTPEPKPENLVWTKKQLYGKKYDLCVVVDPDADRLVLIDENGEILSEEFLLPLIARSLKQQNTKGTIVVNLSTSRMIDEAVKDSALIVLRSAVGERNVVQTMKTHEAIFGGEGSGSTIDPQVHYGRDSLVGIVHIINLLRSQDKSISELVDTIPKLTMKKLILHDMTDERYHKLVGDIAEKVRQKPSCVVSRIDGFHVSTKEWWLHIRQSNTEPLVRIYCEAKSPQELHSLLQELELAEY